MSADPSQVLGELGAGAMLGYDLLRGTQMLPGQKYLTNAGGSIAQQGITLQQQGLTGTLPAGLRAGVDQATEAAQARSRQQFAGQGLAHSTMAVQAQNEAETQRASLEGQMSLGLVKQGLAMTGVGGGMLQDAVKIYGEQLNDLTKAMGAFTKALAGGV